MPAVCLYSSRRQPSKVLSTYGGPVGTVFSCRKIHFRQPQPTMKGAVLVASLVGSHTLAHTHHSPARAEVSYVSCLMKCISKLEMCPSATSSSYSATSQTLSKLNYYEVSLDCVSAGWPAKGTSRSLMCLGSLPGVRSIIMVRGPSSMIRLLDLDIEMSRANPRT